MWCGGEICEERDASGSVVQKRFYEQGVQDNGVKIHYTRDHLGSIREKTDTGNQVTARYDYDQWGRQTVLAGSKDTFGYAGYFVHSPSGLLLTWYRAYDPNLGRWISRDPIEEHGGLNLYAYVENEPINFTDPQGLIMLICYRRGWDQGKNPLKYFTQHSYFYWPHPGGAAKNEQTCGRYTRGPVPENPREEDPENTVCLAIPGSEGKEQDLIDCCKRKNQQKRPYIPVKSDCQTDTTDCLKGRGMLPPPGNPGRFRRPGQSVRDNTIGTPYVFP